MTAATEARAATPTGSGCELDGVRGPCPFCESKREAQQADELERAWREELARAWNEEMDRAWAEETERALKRDPSSVSGG